MSPTPKAPNRLYEEFPEHAETISRLEREDPDFQAKAQEYHELSRAATRTPGAVPTEEVADLEIEKNRGLMRDELMRMILR